SATAGVAANRVTEGGDRSMRGKTLRTALLAALLAGVALTLTALAYARHSPTGAAGAKPAAIGAKAAVHPSLMTKGQRVRVTRHPAAPADILYSQYDNDSGAATSSQNFEPANDAFDDELADDFVVPSGDNWAVTFMDVSGQYFNGSGPSDSFNVVIYADDGAGLPASVVATRSSTVYIDSGGVPSDFTITLSP